MGPNIGDACFASPLHDRRLLFAWDGKATDHMLRFLAPLFGVAIADIEVVFGRESVHKQLRIRSPQKLPAVFGKNPAET